jgi:hypothetical protein
MPEDVRAGGFAELHGGLRRMGARLEGGFGMGSFILAFFAENMSLAQ